MGEGTAAAGRDLSVLSELDWLVAGSNDILGKLAVHPRCDFLIKDLHLAQRYNLQIARDSELLGKSAAARYANLVWRIRDGHLPEFTLLCPDTTGRICAGHLWASLSSSRKR